MIKRSRHGTGGFTLLEILLAIAIIGLIATTIIGASARLLSEKPTNPDDVFWQATMASRKAALLSGNEVRLDFDPKAKAFVLHNGAATKIFLVPSAGDDFGVDFVASRSAGSSTLIGGALIETQSLPYVSFYADGTCVPFRVQIRNKGGAHALSIDPWTCARVLNPSEATHP